MLAVTGGKERTESQWRALLAEANLNFIGIQSISAETCSIIEAKR